MEDTLADTLLPIEYAVPYHDAQGQMQQLKKNLKIKIPVGAIQGEQIRLKGQGAPGIGNSAAGDLYVHLRLIPHQLFDVEGHNLIITLPLTPWEAALGAKITLPTLNGKVQLTVQPNSQTGQRLRVKGKGLIGKNGVGDLFAILKIVLPPTSNDTLKKLWTQLAENAAFDPRTEWSK